MDIRYQVFISSTYADLKDERRSVIQTLMEMDCIPAGMELFPAADEEQFEFIKRVIDDCDYYVLIIGGRYGSMTEAGISYTESEYDYAVNKGLKVIALVHEKPDEIPLGKSEREPEIRAKLERFRAKVQTGRLVRTWSSASDLPGLVSLSLTKTIKMFPSIGWIRANRIASEDLLNEMNELRKQKEVLEMTVRTLSTEPHSAIEGLAGLEESFEIYGKGQFGHDYRSWKIAITWAQIFGHIAPLLVQSPNDTSVRSLLSKTLAKLASAGEEPSHPYIEEQLCLTISVQLTALGLVKIDYSQKASGVWALTSAGEQLMFELRTVRSRNP